MPYTEVTPEKKETIILENRKTKKMAWGGLDPDSKGAFALLTQDDHLEIVDYTEDGYEVNDVLEKWLQSYNIVLTFIERQQAFPKQGSVSTFKIGKFFGTWLGILISNKIPFVEQRPVVWQKGLITPGSKKDKKKSLLVVRQLFPQFHDHFKRVKDHGRADATLMAWHVREQHSRYKRWLNEQGRRRLSE